MVESMNSDNYKRPRRLGFLVAIIIATLILLMQSCSVLKPEESQISDEERAAIEFCESVPSSQYLECLSLVREYQIYSKKDRFNSTPFPNF